MAKKPYKAKEVVAKPRQTYDLHSQAMSMSDAVLQIRVSGVSSCRWRKAYSGVKAGQPKPLTRLKRENSRVNEPVLDFAPHKRILEATV